jgi:hypothetical protein
MLNYRDISPTNGLDLDEKCAADHFFGLTIDQAFDTFAGHPEYYLADFLYMGDKAFGYYFPIVIKHIFKDVQFWIEQYPQLDLLLEIIKGRRGPIDGYKLDHRIVDALDEIMNKAPKNYLLNGKRGC